MLRIPRFFAHFGLEWISSCPAIVIPSPSINPFDNIAKNRLDNTILPVKNPSKKVPIPIVCRITIAIRMLQMKSECLTPTLLTFQTESSGMRIRTKSKLRPTQKPPNKLPRIVIANGKRASK